MEGKLFFVAISYMAGAWPLFSGSAPPSLESEFPLWTRTLMSNASAARPIGIPILKAQKGQKSIDFSIFFRPFFTQKHIAKGADARVLVSKDN